MTPNRRDLLIGAAAAGISLPMLSLPAQGATATRRFRAYLGSSKAGTQIISVSRDGQNVVVTNQTDLVARLLGIPVYRYKLNSREVWRDGMIQAINATGTDNGRAHFVNATRTSGGLQVDGSKYKGLVSGNPTTSSFVHSNLINQKTWVSTQTGQPLSVNVAKRGATTFPLPTGSVPCTHYHFSGKLKYPVDAYFAQNGDLLGYMFEIKGQRARIISDSAEPAFQPIWG